MFSNAISELRSIGKDPGKSLQLTSIHNEGNHVIRGILSTADNKTHYPIVNGVPCFLEELEPKALENFKNTQQLIKSEQSNLDISQQKTNLSFSDKWTRFKNYGFDKQHETFLFDWYCKKLGLKNEEDLKTFYRDREKILEVGPGSGFNAKFMASHCKGKVFALDISDAAFTTFENTCNLDNCIVLQADLNDAPFSDNNFDLIIADGVLHHTPDTYKSLQNLIKKLKPGGQIFFYVYKKMGAARQFCDQYIREQFTRLSPEACYQACEGITELGQALSKLNAKVYLEKPIPILGIPSGTHDVQRLIYYNFIKCFWNEAFDYDTNNMVNFDWYHPHIAWQHTEKEVENWLQDLGIQSYEFHDANPNGISVLCKK